MRPRLLGLGMMVFLLAAAAAPAATQPTTAPATQPASAPSAAAPAADKSQFNLFRPTPADRMRDMDQDRPNLTNTPHTIDAGHLQVETGLFDFTHFRDRTGGGNLRSDAWNLGQFNLRTGVLDSAEVNVIVTSFEFLDIHDFQAGRTSRSRGFGDTVVGGKLNLWGNESGDRVWATSLGLQPQVKLPTAGDELGNGHAEGLLNVPFLMNLPAGFHLGLMTSPQWERNSNNDGWAAGWVNSVCLDRVIFDKFDLFAEFASHVTDEAHTQGQGTVDLGVVYQITPNLSLDTAVNIGVNKATPAVECTVGLSFRF